MKVSITVELWIQGDTGVCVSIDEYIVKDIRDDRETTTKQRYWADL